MFSSAAQKSRTLFKQAPKRAMSGGRPHLGAAGSDGSVGLGEVLHHTWPVAIAIGAGCGLCAYYVFRCAFFHSDVQWSKNTRSITGVDSFDDHNGSDGLRKGNVLRHFKNGEEVIPQIRTLSGDLPAAFKH